MFLCKLKETSISPEKDIDATCGHLGLGDYMTVEIIVIFAALLLVHIPFWYMSLIVIDVKADGGTLNDAFPFLGKPKRLVAGAENAGFEEEATGAGDSDVQAEKRRVQQLLYNPSTDQEPVVLIHVSKPNLKKGKLKTNFFFF